MQQYFNDEQRHINIFKNYRALQIQKLLTFRKKTLLIKESEKVR